MSALGHRGEEVVENDIAVGGLREVERNLWGLTMGVPPLRRRDVPLHLQRHTVGVPESLNHLLRRVTREVVCYVENNVIQEDD
jgi:hypothetical protein